MKPECLPHAKRFITTNSEICSGCRTCEAVCSLCHEGVVSPGLSRIQVMTWPFEGYRSEVYACRQCDATPCLAVCPTGALRIDSATDAVVIDEKGCTGCRSCMEACPQKPTRIRYHAEKGVCIKCDLCGGEPLCVKYCMEGALRLGKA
jgi:Fe-S-cluster-containing hydrogenase component 2